MCYYVVQPELETIVEDDTISIEAEVSVDNIDAALSQFLKYVLTTCPDRSGAYACTVERCLRRRSACRFSNDEARASTVERIIFSTSSSRKSIFDS